MGQFESGRRRPRQVIVSFPLIENHRTTIATQSTDARANHTVPQMWTVQSSSASGVRRTQEPARMPRLTPALCALTLLHRSPDQVVIRAKYGPAPVGDDDGRQA